MKPVCLYDDHAITGWDECPNYKSYFSTEIPFHEKAVILLGKSAAGKDYIANFLKDNYGFQIVVSHTTRPIRENEIDGIDYHFVSTQQFSEMMKYEDFIETREYTTNFNGEQDLWYYGISKDEFNNKQKKICIVDLGGLNAISKYYGDENIIKIY